MGNSLDQLRRFEVLCELYLRRVHQSVASEDFTAADMRIVQVLAMPNGRGSGAGLANASGLDPGYVSRILRKLDAYELVTGQDSATDKRAREWELTDQGRDLAATMDRALRERTWERLDLLPSERRRRLVEAMSAVEQLLLVPAIYR